jgi:hypothetical protein
MPEVDRSKITVIHCDPFTGHILDPNGSMLPAQEPYPTFATEEEAGRYCQEIVRRYPHLECHVVGPGLAGWRWHDEGWVHRESERRRAADEKRRRLDLLIVTIFWVVAAMLGIGLLVGGWLLVR